MNLGFSEMLFLFFLAMIIFGPRRLPEIGRQIGRFMAEFKRASNEFQSQLNDEVRKLELEGTVEEAKQTIGNLKLMQPEHLVQRTTSFLSNLEADVRKDAASSAAPEPKVTNG
jgi:sec-independent protein translocase protein TatB